MKIKMQFNVPHADRNKAGVYLIRNTVDKRVYVGSTKDLRRRFNDHHLKLAKGIHKSGSLQAFVTEHSVNDLIFELVCLCETHELFEKEQVYLDQYQAYDKKHGFNRATLAISTKGITHSAEVKSKMRKAAQNRSPEHRAKLSISAITTMTGRPVSEETRAKIGKGNRGRKPTPEALANMSAAQQARWANAPQEAKDEFRKRVTNGSSPLTQQKRIAALKGVPKSPEAKVNMAAAAKKRANTPEVKAKLKERFSMPEAKAAFVEKMKQGRMAKRDGKKESPGK